MKKTIFSLMLILFTHQVNAIENHLLLGLGLDFGGNKIAEAFFTNGDNVDIRSHEGIALAGGIYSLFTDNLGLQATVGYKSDSANAKNGDISFKRIPMELLAMYQVENHRIGGGLAYHMNTEYECKADSICDVSIEYDNALGAVISYDYSIKASETKGTYLIGAKYSNMTYNPVKSGKSLNGSGIGIFLGMYF